MFRCVVHVNVPASTLTESFRCQLTDSIVKHYNISKEDVTVWVREGLRLMRDGTREPCGFIELFGCDPIFDNAEKNKKDSTALLQLLHKESGIPVSRLFVLMRPQWNTNWGKAGGQHLVIDN